MREIKFRAWDKIEKRFWYFTLQEILERRMNYSGSWDMTILKSEKSQYTGLKDKNGKEIYEGDIVKLTVNHYEDCSRKKLIRKEEKIGVIAFDYCSFGIKDNPEDTCIQLLSWILGLDHEIEVIGDIYRNPELMEVNE